MQTYPMAIITEPGKVAFEDHPMNNLLPDEVRIKVKYAAICGSDLHLYKGLHPSVSLPSAVGHELSGVVIEKGSEVTNLQVGDRVTVEPVIACGKCHFCLRGQYHLCQDVSFHYRRGQGAFGEYFIAPARYVFRLPDSVSLETGALVEPLSVALHAVNKCEMHLGQSTAVFGAGAIGLLVVMLASRRTQGQTFSIDINQFRLDKALEIGATMAINNLEENSVETILNQTERLGVDFSFEAAGFAQTLEQTLQSVRKGGLSTLIGIFEDPFPKVPINLFIQKEITLSGSQGYNWDFQDALTILDQNKLSLETLVTHRFPLEKVQDAFSLLTQRGNQAIKVLIEM
ncbi:alcohol dehydrogenase catalytic domain-containing protein [Chloroflexota bacterium]|nr:alcohol dehydrogenase catalytic domain-containing protein [Chloroflexota bacterium]